MSESTCQACGANIDIATVVGTEERVALEKYTDASTDAPRYRIVGVNPLRVERVPDSAPGDFYPDHNFDCKDSNAGRTF
jgi:hypothetical protein